MKPSHCNNTITGNALRHSSDGYGFGIENRPQSKQVQGWFTKFGKSALFRIFVMSRRFLLVLTVLVIGCGAAWAQQGGVVRIKQIYLTTDANFQASPSPKKNFLNRQCEIDLKVARKFWKKIGIEIQVQIQGGQVLEVQHLPGPITLASAHQWASTQFFGDVIPVIYIDEMSEKDPGNAEPESHPGKGLNKASIVLWNRYEPAPFGIEFLAAGNNLNRFRDSLAHEIGHVLLNDSRFPVNLRYDKVASDGWVHLANRDHLMSSGLAVGVNFVRPGIIDFLPMSRTNPITGILEYRNQVEAMYTASSYVTDKTELGLAATYIWADFYDSARREWMDGKWFNPGLKFGARQTQTVGLINHRTNGYNGTVIRRQENLPLDVSAYSREVEPGIIGYSWDINISPETGLQIPTEFIPRAPTPGMLIKLGVTASLRMYDLHETVEIILGDGQLKKLVRGTDYQWDPSGLTLQPGVLTNGMVLRIGVHWSLPAGFPPSTRGDFNTDGVVNNADIALLYTRMGQSSTTYDLNGDGQVSLGDVLELMDLIPGALLGDLNFDGVVNAADLAALNGGWGTAAGRSGGDIDGDGLVTEVDLMLLAGDWQSPPATSHGVLLARPQDRIATPFSRQSVPVWDVSWTASAGVSYQLETSSNLVSWSPIGSPLTGAGNPVRRLVEMPVIGKQGFVRLKGTDARQAGFAGAPEFNADRLTWEAQAGEIFTIENWVPLDAVSTNGFWLAVATVQVATNGNQKLAVPAVDDLGHGKRFRVLRVASVSNTPSPDLAENNAAQWGTFASDNATASVSNSTVRIKDGATAILLTTASGFDTGVKYPAATTMNFDASTFNSLTFWEYPENTTPIGWQDPQPIVVIRTSGGTITLTPDTQLMGYDAWQKFEVPLAGGTGWIRTATGTPDISHVTQIEIHHDTWDSGFRIWLDGVRFGNSLPD